MNVNDGGFDPFVSRRGRSVCPIELYKLYQLETSAAAAVIELRVYDFADSKENCVQLLKERGCVHDER